LDDRERSFLLILASENPAKSEDEAKTELLVKINKRKKIDLQRENEILKTKIREESNEERRINMLAELARNQREIAALQKKKTEIL
jgi:thioesterase domain-containing protein